jgi:2-C-methyl-D-erythritol 4-phosphate cytidylyltransferase
VTSHDLVLLNGGFGGRARTGLPKQFTQIAGRPMLAYSLAAADAADGIGQIIINYPGGWRETVERVVADCGVGTPVRVVPAGATRQESVAAMLPHCTSSRVLIHESARPMVTASDFTAIMGSPHPNVTYVRPIPFTVARVDDAGMVVGHIDRDLLRDVQLPQRFVWADLLAAHEYAARSDRVWTEDAALCVAAGFDVHTATGPDCNIKVTTPGDVTVAAGYLLGVAARG